ncbi:MAG: response regulator transcription factor [Sandarakinorhabdus sp.]|nr:response regulator transcription factor [Sandarakinorhabdus sp.]
MPDLCIAERELDHANRVQAAAAMKVAVLRSATFQGPGYVRQVAVPSISTAQPMATAPIGLPGSAAGGDDRGHVFVVDHDGPARSALRCLLDANGLHVEAFADAAAFLAAYRRRVNACLLANPASGNIGGLSLLHKLGADADPMPVIMITDCSDIGMAVDAMKAGAADFIARPIGDEALVASIMRALEGGRLAWGKAADRGEALNHFEALTPRQRQIMALVLSGHPSKNIASELGISQRTVENHRAAIMRKSGSKSLPALARLALKAGEPLLN